MVPDHVTRVLTTKPTPLARAARRAEVEQQQRSRILDATLSIATVAGYAELSIASILALAQVQRRTFNGMFGGKEDAFLAAYRDLVGQLAGQLVAAYDAEAAPSERVVDCLDAVVTFLLADPVRAEFVLLEVHAAGVNAVGLQRSALDVLVDRTAAMLAEAGVGDDGRARLGAEFAIGAVHETLRASMHRGELDRLPEQTPDLARAAFPMLSSGAVEAARPSAANGQTNRRRLGSRSSSAKPSGTTIGSTTWA